MKKIVLTTEQLDKISEYVKNEDETAVLNEISDDNRYRMEVKVDFNYSGLKYQGKEVDYITTPTITLSYLIDIEHRTWGIKSISLYDIQGPDEIDIDVSYFINDEYDTDEATVTLKPSWEGIDSEKESGSFIGLDSEIEIDLENDSEGNIVVSGMGIYEYTIS